CYKLGFLPVEGNNLADAGVITRSNLAFVRHYHQNVVTGLEVLQRVLTIDGLYHTDEGEERTVDLVHSGECYNCCLYRIAFFIANGTTDAVIEYRQSRQYEVDIAAAFRDGGRFFGVVNTVEELIEQTEFE